MKVNLIILQLSHADSFGVFDKASLMHQTSFNQSQIGLCVLHKIKKLILFFKFMSNALDINYV